MDQNTCAGGCSSETQVPLLQLSLMDSKLPLENKMVPLSSDPIIDNERFGFSQELINHPSEQKSGKWAVLRMSLGNCRSFSLEVQYHKKSSSWNILISASCFSFMADSANLSSQSTGCGAPSSQTKVDGAQQELKYGNPEVQDDLFWLTDGTPYFHLILTKSHVRSPYQLGMPAKMQRILPNKEVPVVLAHGNKSWKMTYLGDDRPHKRFGTNWRQFVVDNNLKIGDGCVFELLECSEALIKFRVKILSGDLPAEFLDRFDGLCAKKPIVLN